MDSKEYAAKALERLKDALGKDAEITKRAVDYGNDKKMPSWVADDKYPSMKEKSIDPSKNSKVDISDFDLDGFKRVLIEEGRPDLYRLSKSSEKISNDRSYQAKHIKADREILKYLDNKRAANLYRGLSEADGAKALEDMKANIAQGAAVGSLADFMPLIGASVAGMLIPSKLDNPEEQEDYKEALKRMREKEK
jgi:hypothetical protein